MPEANKVLAKIAKNAGANLLRLGVSWVIVLLLPPLLVRVLDKPAYATWVLILQIGAYVSLFDGGIQSAISRFVGRAHEMQDRESLRQTVSSAGSILVAGALLTAAATLVCCWQLEHLFHGIPLSVAAAARLALLIIGVSLALSLPFSTLAGMFLGLQRNEVNAAAGALGKMLGAVGAGFAAWRHEGLAIMALWIALGNLLQSAILYAWARRSRLHELVGLAHITGAAVQEFVRFCYAMFATQLSALLITGMDMPVVAAFDFSAAAYYAVASTASNMLAVPQGAIVTSLIPVAAGMSATESPERLGQALLRITRYATAVLCLLTLPLLCGLPVFLRLWVGADYAAHAEWFAAILIVAQFVRLTLMPYAVIGFGAGQQDRMLLSPVAEGVVNLACSVAGAWRWGAIGVAVGTLIGAVVGVACHFGVSMPRTDSMRFSRRKLLGVGLAKPIACTLPGLLISLSLHPEGSILVDLGTVGCVTALSFFTVWKICFSNSERLEIERLLSAVLSRMYPMTRQGA